MGITGREYTDLFVFTTHGHILERIDFDENFWNDLLQHLEWFWFNHLGPEILTGDIRKRLMEVAVAPSPDKTFSNKSIEILSSKVIGKAKRSTPLQQKRKKKENLKRKQRSQRDMFHNIFVGYAKRKSLKIHLTIQRKALLVTNAPFGTT